MSDTGTFPRMFARTRRFTLGEPRSVTICADGRRVLFLRSAAGDDPRTGLWRLDLPAGEETPVVDPSTGAGEDLPAEERARRERVRETATGVVSYAADGDGRVVAVPLAGRLWVADVDAGSLREVDTAGAVFDPRPDPTGTHVAYVSGRTLRVVGVDGTGDRVLAPEDDEAVSWGKAEHVAAEEMDRSRGYWWAPDGATLLATRVDESAVPVWWIADPAHPDRPPTPMRYPAAGADNADVSLYLLTLDPHDTARREIRWDRAAFPYLARVVWVPGHEPLLAVQTRDQRTVRVLAVDVADGSTRVLHEDRGDPWVELFPGSPAWCGERVVRIADVDGLRRVMVGDEPVSPVEVHVRGIAGTSEDAVVFTGSAGDPTQVHVWRWSAAGAEQLTSAPGVHGAVADGPTVVLATSTMEQVGQRHVVRYDDGERPLASYALTPSLAPAVRLLTLGSREIRTGLLLPRDHRPGTRLPVLMDPYGGPHAQRVLAGRRIWLEPQWWADQGFAVLVADGRGTPGRSVAWEHEVHLRLAEVVLEDQVDALHAAAEVEPDLDLTRVGIRGWSFGGYLAAMAVLRRPDVFHAAIAGAPVTEQALYDTHYTERYLGRPQDNPEVYRRNSLLDDAPGLSRALLLVHGIADDNVVAAHTLLLSQRLTEAGRPHTVLPLSGVTHMTPQETVAENLLLLQLDFLRRALGPAQE